MPLRSELAPSTRTPLMDDSAATEAKTTEARSSHGVSGIFALDLDVNGWFGETSDDLGLEDSFDVGRTTFSAPSHVELDYSVARATAALRGGAWFRRAVRVDGSIGLAAERSELEFSSGSIEATETTFAIGPRLGIGLGWAMTRNLQLQGNVREYCLFGSAGRVVLSPEADAALALAVTRHVDALAGWRWTRYLSAGDGVDVDLTLSGPFFGIRMLF
jgi:hypothetical protein